MYGGDHQSGFTIIETIIFLGVSAALFLGVIGLINNSVNKTEFSQGVKQFASQIQTIVDQVKTGTYDNYTDFGCEAPLRGDDQTDLFPVTNKPYIAQGSNFGCTFIGRVIQFYPTGGASSGSRLYFYGSPGGVARDNTPDNQVAVVYTIVGRQFVDKRTSTLPKRAAGPATTLTDAEPRIIGQRTSFGGAPAQDTTRLFLPPGLVYADVSYSDNSVRHYNSLVGFFSAFSGGQGDALSGGSLQANLIPVPSNTGATRGNEFFPENSTFCYVMQMQNDSTNSTLSSKNPIIDSNLLSCNQPALPTTINPSEGVQICLQSTGLKNQYGLITIGGKSTASNGSPLSVTSSTYYGTNCP